MKKILFVLSAVAVLFGAASCEKDNLGGNKETANPLNNITVTKDTDSKLAIDDKTLTPAFEIDDEIFGWDSEGTAYAYTCTEVTEDAATFTRTSSGAPSADEGTVVNLVYAPGYKIKDIVDKTLDVNLAVQGETLPVIMHISGTVDEEGICRVTFLNDVAIVDVKDAVLPDAVEDEEYTVSFHGKNTSLKFTLDEDGSLVVAPASEGPISSSEKAKVSADSKISKKFAVPASLEATDVIIDAMAADGSTYTFSAGSKNIVAGKYITVAGKEFAPQYVAQIGSDKYMTIAKAFAAANEATGETAIQLLMDCEAQALAVNVGKSMILDLNHCILTAPIDVKGSFVVNNGDNSTNDGTIQLTDYGNCVINVNSGAVATINAGTFLGRVDETGEDYSTLKALGEKDGDVAEMNINSAVVRGSSSYGALYYKYANGDVKNADVECSNSSASTNTRGLFASTNSNVSLENCKISGVHSVHFGSSSAVLELIDNNVFKASKAIFNVSSYSGTLTVPADKSNYFDFSANEAVLVNGNNRNNLKIYGGYYSGEPNFVSIGYLSQKLDSPVTKDGVEYNFTIVENLDKNVIKVGEEKFEDVTEAVKKINAAESSVTVTLLSDIDVATPIEITNSIAEITLDLNGHVLASTSDKGALVVNDAASVVNLVDGEGTGKIDNKLNNTSNSVILNAGTLNVVNASVCNTQNYGKYGRVAIFVAAANGAATLNVKGGSVRGSRAIGIGGGEKDKPATVNISAGLVEGLYNVEEESNFYAAIYFTGDYGFLNITGGVIKSDKARATIYSSKQKGKIVIRKGEGGTVPFIYCAAKIYMLGAGSNSRDQFWIYDMYANYNKVQNSAIRTTNTGTEVNTLESPVKDEFGNEYGFEFVGADKN